MSIDLSGSAPVCARAVNDTAAAATTRLPRLCVVSHMVGHTPGFVTTQAQILSELFTRDGYPVITASGAINRYRWLADVMTTLTRRRDDTDVLVLDIFGGRSFVVEDLASQLGSRFGHRIIMTLRGGAMPEFMRRFPNWTRRVLARADVLVVPSEFLARTLGSFGFRARVIPNVVDLARYPYRHRPRVAPRLLWMRSFHQIYNPLMAVRVLALLRSAGLDATLVMGGQDKGLEADARQLAASMGLAGAITFAGFLDAQRKITEGSAADIFINTNHVDNMPVAVIEAGAMGLPIVATRVGGIPDLIRERETGLLVGENDDHAMAHAIRELVSDPELAGRLSTNGRRLAEGCAWSAVRSQWEHAFTGTFNEVAREGMFQ